MMDLVVQAPRLTDADVAGLLQVCAAGAATRLAAGAVRIAGVAPAA